MIVTPKFTDREMISQLTCPVCRKKVVLEETDAMPFCSLRCRNIDLGRWLDEAIGVPVEPGEYHESDESEDIRS